jgi:hypothetical protein
MERLDEDARVLGAAQAEGFWRAAAHALKTEVSRFLLRVHVPAFMSEARRSGLWSASLESTCSTIAGQRASNLVAAIDAAMARRRKVASASSAQEPPAATRPHATYNIVHGNVTVHGNIEHVGDRNNVMEGAVVTGAMQGLSDARRPEARQEPQSSATSGGEERTGRATIKAARITASATKKTAWIAAGTSIAIAVIGAIGLPAQCRQEPKATQPAVSRSGAAGADGAAQEKADEVARARQSRYAQNAFDFPFPGVAFQCATGLAWQRAQPARYAGCTGRYTEYDGDPGDACSWTEAKRYCASLGLAGGGWRLPEQRELSSIIEIVDGTPSINPEIFPGRRTDAFWTATPTNDAGNEILYVHFGYPEANGDAPASQPLRVRCVR